MEKLIKQPKIKSFNIFKECILKNEREFGFGKTIKFYSLYYGFNQEIEIKGAKNLKDAYNIYKKSYYYYDQYVTPNSFLNH